MKKILALAIVSLTLGACTSATTEIIHQKKPSTPDIAETIKQNDNGLKRLVAIARFSDETKRSNNVFVNQNGNRLGKQASDILSSRLNATGKFVMLERADLELLEHEKQLSDAQSKSIPADYVLVGSVSEFGRETTSEVGIFSRNLIQRATARVNVRLINVNSSEVIYSEEASGTATSEANQVFGVGESAAYNTALDDKAISAAISKLVGNIMNNLLDQPWRTYILSEEENQLIIAGGQSQGITQGTKLAVYQPGKKVTNPQTGKSIELPGEQVAAIEVVKNYGKGDNEISYAKVVSGIVDSKNLKNYRIIEL